MVDVRTAGRRPEQPAADTPIDLNEANREELRAIDGIGEARADAIVAWRERHGRFASVDDLQQLDLFPPDVVAQVRDSLKV